MVRNLRIAALAIVVATGSALAVEIENVEVAALDQPRVTLMVRRTPNGKPLAAKGDAGLGQLLGLDKQASENVAGFAAFLDTGASGILISGSTADALGVVRLRVGPDKRAEEIVFHDVGVGGTDQFNVSEPLLFYFGRYEALGGLADETSMQPAGGPWSCQVGPLGGGGVLESIIGGVDVLGMPAMVGKIVVMDARPVSKLEDVIHVQLLTPEEARRTRLPRIDRHVVLSYGDFGPYTFTEPANAQRPATAPNPFIGPDPTGRNPRKATPITIGHGSKTSQAAWLLDTGAAASMISVRQAKALGVTYKEGTQGTPNPVLEGVPRERQFTLTVGGIGGMKKSAGFYLDELRVPTSEGDDLIYRPAPVLVSDVTVEDPRTKEKLTLDGVFGMNFLVASAKITEGLVPQIGETVSGPFDMIVIDHVEGVMGVQLAKELAGERRRETTPARAPAAVAPRPAPARRVPAAGR